MKTIHTRKIYSICLFLVTVLITFSGCQTTSSETTQKEPTITMTISAAKSLSECLPSVVDAYQAANPDTAISMNFGSSGSMRQQIEQGADADIYMPAGVKDMNLLNDESLVLAETVSNLLANQIVLVVPASATLPIETFEDLPSLDDIKIAVGEPESVPAGKYGVETLKSVGIFDAIEPDIVYAKDVREVLTWVQTGNADAGIVYLTEAKLTEDVKVVATAEADTHTPITYPVAVVSSSKNVDAANQFISYLKSDEAMQIFEQYGYTAAKE
ncbi:molybdate ABC transporter substrate-binding protein [Fusibacter paucivorans]|uniref:Molybdate ABC transporter substrate-binding protein n=1 Tax=Fusibacter paucivorans TaxID=76009 RepID=A0ABS5PTE1_9FIRM|nr:molybdate ABC transporter substrate-binding protein [Fusibacter paucivorans]MBS7528444.1 molybdate ABC transporter substrate-binding protein [Fusibacter paucivorans]